MTLESTSNHLHLKGKIQSKYRCFKLKQGTYTFSRLFCHFCFRTEATFQ